jgi:hypothetical protein
VTPRTVPRIERDIQQMQNHDRLADMKFTSKLFAVAVVAILGWSLCSAAARPATKPALRFGRDASLPLPKTLVFSINPDRIIEDAQAWKDMGADGFFMDGAASEWYSDVWATDGKPYTIGASDATFQKVRKATQLCKKLGMQVFMRVSFGHPFEWFNDTAWQQIRHNFKEFAIFARDTGCAGVALDIEYIGQQYAFDWEGYDYKGYTREDLIARIRQRATEMLDSLYQEYPDMVFFFLPGEGFSLGTQMETAWIEEAAKRDAPGGVHLFTEGTYNSKNVDRLFANVGAENELYHRLLSPLAREYWERRCSIAAGIFPVGFDIALNHDPRKTPDEIRRCWAGTLMVSKRYNWIYVDRFADQHIGKKLDAYKGTMDFKACAEVLRAREIVTNPGYIKLARELRTLSPNAVSGQMRYAAAPRFMFPYMVPTLELADTSEISPVERDRDWQIALDYYAGKPLDLPALFGPVRNWQIIGPFPSSEPLTGHKTVFPPEQGIDLAASYDGAHGKVKWQPYQVPEGALGIDFKKLYTPNEEVTAYALCYVDSPREQQVQARFGTNDSGKLWIGGRLVDDFGDESWAVLDRDIVRVTLPKGRTPILAKVTNGKGAWAMVLRFTDPQGKPIPNLTFTATP